MNRIIELLQEIFSATDEQTKSFTDAMKAKKIYTASEENMDVRFGKLKEQSAAKDKQLKEFQDKIAAYESGMTGQEALQQDLTAAQTKIADLEAKLKKSQVEAQGHMALLAAGANSDAIDFLMFRLQADGELEQDENGKVKGLEEKINALKTQQPVHFGESGDGGNGGYQVYQPNKLKQGNGGDLTYTKEQFRTMSYEERLALKQKNENLYRQLANNAGKDKKG